MSVQTVESYKSFGSYERVKARQSRDLFPKFVFAMVVGIGYAGILAAFLYPIYMNEFAYPF